jgi:hypothetical protein
MTLSESMLEQAVLSRSRDLSQAIAYARHLAAARAAAECISIQFLLARYDRPRS